MSSSRRLRSLSLSVSLRAFFLPLSLRFGTWFFLLPAICIPFFPALSSVLKKCSSSRYIPKQHSNKLSWAAATKSASHTVNLHKEAMSYICRSWIAVAVAVAFFSTTSQSLSCTFFFFRSQKMNAFFLVFIRLILCHTNRLTDAESESETETQKECEVKKFSIYVNVYNA